MYKNLVIGPGGMGAYALLGCLSRNIHLLKDIKAYSGSSAGSVLAFLLALGKKPVDIFDLLLSIDLKKATRFSLKNIFTKYGFIDHSQLKEALLITCERDYTFEEVPNDLYISVYNLTYSRTEYFSRYTHPKMSVLDTLCMSMSIPIIICSCTFNDCIYIDGATVEDAPITPFIGNPVQDNLTIKINYKKNENKINSIKTFISALTQLIIFTKNDSKFLKSFSTVLEISLDSLSVTDFNMTTDQAYDFFMKGYHITYEE
tara:strand:- start:296 stop:1072 length:777 start_codon:yes stop_codon:yes gene_type:complete